MISSLKAELRKLLSVRSTYFITLAALLLSGFVTFWVYGYKDVEQAGLNSDVLFHALYAVASIVGLFMSFIVILLVGHEYRYNTITYTLTANTRSKVLMSKFIVATLFSLAASLAIALICTGLFYLGLKLHHVEVAAQYISLASLSWHAAAYIAGNVAFAFIVVVLARSLIGAIAFILVVPTTVEQLLGLLLKDNVKYLPFTALGNLTSTETHVSSALSLGAVAAYSIVGGLIAWAVFLRRDAS